MNYPLKKELLKSLFSKARSSFFYTQKAIVSIPNAKVTDFIQLLFMPINQPLQKNIYCWKNIESVDELISILVPNSNQLEKINRYKSIERQKQYLTTRLLLQKAVGNYQLERGENNKPFLKDLDLEISFTHNKEYTLLMTSKITCGIDIQAPSKTTVRIREKFINYQNQFICNKKIYTIFTIFSFFFDIS